MSRIKSLEDLKRIREEALGKSRVRTTSGKVQVNITMGTCSIATGARDTMNAILNFIEVNGLSGIIVTQTGCIGMCEREPIVQVTIGIGDKITYGKVNPEAAERIMKEHVISGQVVKDFVVPT